MICRRSRRVRRCAFDELHRSPSGKREPEAPGVGYLHFIRHDDALYVATYPPNDWQPRLSNELGRVVCTFSGSDTPSSYASSREGEAGFVKEGSPYSAIRGCPSEIAIAAEWEGRQLAFVREPADLSRMPEFADLPRVCR